MNMKYEILKIKFRLLIKKHPPIYKILKRLRDSRSEEILCKSFNNLCIEGYPSSANSFLFVLLQHLNKNLSMGHHTHSIANIKLAYKYKIPIIIVIRTPIDAIASRIVRFGCHLDEGILEYIDFYKFILENYNKFLILDFEEITRNTEGAIKKISSFTDINLKYNDINKLKEKVFNYIKDWSEKRGNYIKMSLPVKKREIEKSKIKKIIIKSEKYKSALNIYNEIKKS